MLGAPVFRTALFGPWSGNALWTAARAVPSFDLPFADSKSLVDAITGRQLISFTRAGSGTYTDSAGVLSTATTNLQTFSEDLSGSLTAIAASTTANAAQSPDGALTADLFVPNTTNAAHSVFRSNISVTGAAAHTFSVYAKAAGYNVLQITPTSGFGAATAWANFVLSGNGSIGSQGSAQAATITPLSDGWYRCTLTATSTVSPTICGPAYVPLDSDRNAKTPAFPGDGTSGIYLWGAQLEQSSTVGEYIPTGSTINSAPRFDHNPLTGESLGLLVEEQRTNLLLRSEEFDNASWNSVAGARTVTANQIAAPDGTTTADLVTADGTTAAHFVSQSLTLSAVPYTYSVFAKAGTNNFLQLRFFVAFGAGFANFNLATGVVGTVSGSVTSSIQAYPNGWYRCTMVFTPTAATSSVAAYIVDSASAAGGLPNSLSTSVYLWGAQLEAGAGPPTSYIPTTTAAATRNADVVSITGTNFSSWYRQDEGTVYVDAIPSSTTASGLAGFDDTTSAERWRVGQAGATAAGFVSVDGNVVQINLSTAGGSLPVNISGKVASAIQLNNSAISANGQTVTEDLSCTMPTVTQITIGTAQASAYANARIRRLTYWPQRLNNATLEAITQS